MSVPGELVLQTVAEDFSDCRDALLEEITDRGIVLTFHSYVADMISRTAEATGEESPYLHAEIVGFCKADISSRMLAADPHNIVFCPQAIFFYELKSHPGMVHFGYRRSTTAAAKPSEELLANIISSAIENI